MIRIRLNHTHAKLKQICDIKDSALRPMTNLTFEHQCSKYPAQIIAKRFGAAVARWAHNPKVRGSKPRIAMRNFFSPRCMANVFEYIRRNRFAAYMLYGHTGSNRIAVIDLLAYTLYNHRGSNTFAVTDLPAHCIYAVYRHSVIPRWKHQIPSEL